MKKERDFLFEEITLFFVYADDAKTAFL